MKPLTPYCSATTLATRDGRTREARLLKNLRAELVAHVGVPSAVQGALITQACQLGLQIALMDRKFAETGTQSEHDSPNISGLVQHLCPHAGPPRPEAS